MTGRELVFSNPAVIRTIRDRFVPVADDVSGLQVADDPVGRFFRAVAVQGHMKGRSRPGVSHQGIYAFTADGVTLASGNPLQAEGTLTLLEWALDAWSAGDRAPADVRVGEGLNAPRDLGYPVSGGAVLRMAARDLPRLHGLPEDQARYAAQWNFDHVWLRPEDVRAFLPETLAIGEERQVPPSLLARIARFYLRDIVRGEPRVWGPDAVKRCDLTARITGIDGGNATISLEGAIVLRERVAFRDAHKPIDWAFDNMLDALVSGEAVWNVSCERFEHFDLLVAGQREGAHRYNVRTMDSGPAPIGFAFELAGEAPWERTPPHALRTWTLPGERQPPVSTVVTGESYYGDDNVQAGACEEMLQR